MSVGPLRRSIGVLGLLALVPLATMVVSGALAPVDAAVRAATVVVVLLVLGRVVGWGIHSMAASLERAASDERGAGAERIESAVPAAERDPAGERVSA